MSNKKRQYRSLGWLCIAIALLVACSRQARTAQVRQAPYTPDELETIPLLLWALPYLDQTVPMPSPMTGLTATGCNLKKAGRFFLHRVGATTPEQIQAVARTARIAATVKGMRRTRFGIIGSPCPGMIDTVCDDSLLQECLGITIVRRDLDSLLEAAQQSSSQEARRLAARLKERVGSSEVGEETIAEQYRLYLGMKSLLERLAPLSEMTGHQCHSQQRLLVERTNSPTSSISLLLYRYS